MQLSCKGSKQEDRLRAEASSVAVNAINAQRQVNRYVVSILNNKYGLYICNSAQKARKITLPTSVTKGEIYLESMCENAKGQH